MVALIGFPPMGNHFDDNFVEPIEGWLVDPVLKIRLGSSAPRESYDFTEAVIHIWYDPEISEHSLTMPLPADLQAVYRATPGFEHKANDPIIFGSSDSQRIGWLNVDLELRDASLIICVRHDLQSLRFKMDDVASAEVPLVSDHDEEFLLYVIKAIPKFSEFRNVNLSKHFPDLKRIEVFILNDAASNFFSVREHELGCIQRGWVSLATAEVSQ